MSFIRPLRSVLYIPCSNARAVDKARGLPADALIFDLEDAVSIEEKETAREILSEALAVGGYGSRFLIVRINAIDTEWGIDDAKAARRMGAGAILLPKVSSYDDLSELSELTIDTPIWAMMETPLGMLNAGQIATHPLLQAMVMGTNDLNKELQGRSRVDRLPMMTGLGLCLLAAKAHKIAIIDGVYNAFKDEEGLSLECEQGRDMGFDGKTVIHPAQLAIANAIFSPSDEDLELAHRQIRAFEEVEANGKSIAVVDGRIVESLHIVTARDTLEKAKAITTLAEEMI